MRKSLLTLGVFVLGILSANAQKMHSMDGAAKRVTPMQLQKVKVAQAPELYVTDQPTTTFRVSPSKIVRNNPRKAEVEISADYGIPTASYFWGMGAGWTGYSAVILTTSPLAKVTFPNYATYDKEQEVTFAWQVPTSQNTYDMEQDEKGNGIGIINKFSLDAISNNLIRLPLKPAINIDIGIEAIDLKDLTPVANEFYSMLRHSYQTHQ